jgi:hypothetical protein
LTSLLCLQAALNASDDLHQKIATTEKRAKTTERNRAAKPVSPVDGKGWKRSDTSKSRAVQDILSKVQFWSDGSGPKAAELLHSVAKKLGIEDSLSALLPGVAPVLDTYIVDRFKQGLDILKLNPDEECRRRRREALTLVAPARSHRARSCMGMEKKTAVRLGLKRRSPLFLDAVTRRAEINQEYQGQFSLKLSTQRSSVPSTSR